jgi:hypothetical protein
MGTCLATSSLEPNFSSLPVVFLSPFPPRAQHIPGPSPATTRLVHPASPAVQQQTPLGPQKLTIVMSSEATSISICDTISNSAGLTPRAQAAAFTTASAWAHSAARRPCFKQAKSGVPGHWQRWVGAMNSQEDARGAGRQAAPGARHQGPPGYWEWPVPLVRPGCGWTMLPLAAPPPPTPDLLGISMWVARCQTLTRHRSQCGQGGLGGK